MSTDLPKAYEPKTVEAETKRVWDAENLFHAEPADPGAPYAIVIPPPNVTAALHLGHALNNTLQDILTRWRRMAGDNAVWMPGTDHAGIATQTVVEKRVLAEQGKRRTDFPRDEFVAKIQAWKDEYEKRITEQLKAMGCSCDWQRQAFTMDEPRARAVREAFFQLFKDGLIYRGKRLVNWDPATQTALADDEVEMEEIDGHFYYLKYPIEPSFSPSPSPGTSGEGRGKGVFYVTVATTRPETMLGDTAVAINPRDPRAARLRGKFVRLPIVNRIVPIIEDDYVVLPDPDSADPKAQFATGFLKVTPAHDPNDYDIGLRHKLPIINVLAPDGSISDQHGWPKEDFELGEAGFLLGLDRFEARKAVVEWFRTNSLLEEVKPYRHSVGHSYRSHVPIEPYLSDQWYCKVTDERLAGAALRAMSREQYESSTPSPRTRGEGGGEGPGSLANQPALDPARTSPLSPTLSPSTGRGSKDWQGQLKFFPARYAKTFQTWHENIRDWCISRQLWWGHRIPVWTCPASSDLTGIPNESPEAQILEKLRELREALTNYFYAAGLRDRYAFYPLRWQDYEVRVCTRSEAADRAIEAFAKFEVDFDMHEWAPGTRRRDPADLPNEFRDALAPASALANLTSGVYQDPDVLDTWFSSGLWPMSVFNWPDDTPALAKWNPTNVLFTDRSIITLWVGRMVMFNLYFLDRLPFTEVNVHATIQDGDGRKMSKSLGNGVDPLDIIASHGADAMRFTLTLMTTTTQDVRMPVEKDPATGRNTSPKFDIGRNFCNKLWNASRFAISNLESVKEKPTDNRPWALADRWILSRLAVTIGEINSALREYRFDQYAKSCYDFFWRDLCDWYIEAIKPAIRDSATASQTAGILAAALDAALRLMHPMIPFITEMIWWRLNEVRPDRSIPKLTNAPSKRLIVAEWPKADGSLIDPQAEATFAMLQEIIGAIRNVRNEYKVETKRVVGISIQANNEMAEQLLENRAIIETLGTCALKAAGPAIESPANAARAMVAGAEVFVEGLVDQQAEGQRIARRCEELKRQKGALEGRLSNESYIKKAPPHLVQQTRDQLAEVNAELEKLDKPAGA
jgi:valyl-tRNA synthetase